jgi:hypothetical protein
MTMGIYVPSMGRAKYLFQKTMTIKFIPNFTFVVPPDEVDAYVAAVRHLNAHTVIGCPAKGIAATRLWIGEYARKKKQDKFLMIDDDLNFAVRKSVDAYNLRPSTSTDIEEMLEWTEDMLNEYAHVSVSPRAVNAGVPALKSGNVETLWQENKRTLRYLAYRTKDFLSVKHGRVPVMEDFDVNLQLLRTGRKNLLSYWWAQDQRETGSPGGCATYRTHALHEEAAHKLAELHAPFVTLREKENKSQTVKAAEAFRKRTEVTIYWEKAYQSSQRS